MQILILTLCLGLAYASYGSDGICSQINGQKTTYRIASSNPAMTTVKAPLRAYVRSMACVNNGEKVSIQFYSKYNADFTCGLVNVIGDKLFGNTYRTDFEGSNTFTFWHMKKTCMVMTIKNTIEKQATYIVELFATSEEEATKCDMEYRMALMMHGIPYSNSEDVHKDDDCPK